MKCAAGSFCAIHVRTSFFVSIFRRKKNWYCHGKLFVKKNRNENVHLPPFRTARRSASPASPPNALMMQSGSVARARLASSSDSAPRAWFVILLRFGSRLYSIRILSRLSYRQNVFVLCRSSALNGCVRTRRANHRHYSQKRRLAKRPSAAPATSAPFE